MHCPIVLALLALAWTAAAVVVLPVPDDNGDTVVTFSLNGNGGPSIIPLNGLGDPFYVRGEFPQHATCFRPRSAPQTALGDTSVKTWRCSFAGVSDDIRVIFYDVDFNPWPGNHRLFVVVDYVPGLRLSSTTGTRDHASASRISIRDVIACSAIVILAFASWSLARSIRQIRRVVASIISDATSQVMRRLGHSGKKTLSRPRALSV